MPIARRVLGPLRRINLWLSVLMKYRGSSITIAAQGSASSIGGELNEGARTDAENTSFPGRPSPERFQSNRQIFATKSAFLRRVRANNSFSEPGCLGQLRLITMRKSAAAAGRRKVCVLGQE